MNLSARTLLTLISLWVFGLFSAFSQEERTKLAAGFAFSPTVEASAVLDAEGTPKEIESYGTPLDAMKAGDFRAFLASEKSAEDEDDVTSHLSYLALAIDSFMLGKEDYRAYLDSVPVSSRDRHIADKISAWFLLLEGKNDDAIAALYEANGSKLSLIEEMSLALLLEGMGRPEQAIAVYSTLLPKDIRRAKNEFDLQKYAIDQYSLIVARMAALHMQAGDSEKASETYEIMIEADPENTARYRGYIADLTSDTPPENKPHTPQTAMSLAIMDLAGQDFRERMFASFRRGTRLTDYDLRYALFMRMALMLEPDDEHRWMSVAEQLSNKRLLEGAAHTLNSAIVKTSWINLTLAEIRLKLLDEDGTREAVHAALGDVKEDDKLSVYPTAMNYFAKLGDTQSTQKLAYRVQSMVEEAPNKAAMYGTLSQAYRDLGRLNKAVNFMRKAVEVDDTHDRRMALWMLLAEAGNVEAAEKGLRGEFLSRLDDPYMLNGLGYFLVCYTDKLEEGYKLLSQADSMADENPYIVDSLGWALYKLGHLDKAKAYIERSREVYMPNIHWEVEDHLGDIYWHQGDEEAANEYWSRSLEQYPPAKDRKRIASKLEKGLLEPQPEKRELPAVDLSKRAEEDKDI